MITKTPRTDGLSAADTLTGADRYTPRQHLHAERKAEASEYKHQLAKIPKEHESIHLCSKSNPGGRNGNINGICSAPHYGAGRDVGELHLSPEKYSNHPRQSVWEKLAWIRTAFETLNGKKRLRKCFAHLLMSKDFCSFPFA